MGSHVPGRVCSYCGVEKPWIFSGKKLRDGSRVYTNEFALRWAGKRCPDCERRRVQEAVKYNSFEKDMILQKLQEAGFRILSQTLPLRVERDGQEYRVGVRRARADEGQITLNQASARDSDVYALVFSSVRICTREQLEGLGKKVGVFTPVRKRKNRQQLQELPGEGASHGAEDSSGA